MIRAIWTAAKIIAATGDNRRAIVQKNQFELYHAASLASYFFRWIPLPIEYIFELNGTDKHRQGHHQYGPHYQRFFSPFRWKRIKLLEIGIGGYAHQLGGRSITAWRWYFPFVRVVACDIQDKSILSARGVTIYRIDQSNEDDLVKLVMEEKSFDLIIDDGSHINAHQIFTFRKLFPSLADGGVYVIEDIQTSYWPDWGGQSIDHEGLTCMTFFLELSHYLNSCEFLPDVDLDDELNSMAEQISTISFHHNLIFVKKEKTKKISNTVQKH